MLSAVPEPRNIVDKYAVSVQRDDEVVGHLMKGKSGRFAKTIFYFSRWGFFLSNLATAESADNLSAVDPHQARIK